MPYKLYLRGGFWYIRGTVRGVGRHETTGIPKAEKDRARAYRTKEEARVYDESIFGKRAVVSFKRAALSYLVDGGTERSDRTVGFVTDLIEHFEKKGKGKRAVKVASVDQVAADEAVTAIVGDGAAPATKNRAVLAPLIAILNHAADRKWCDDPRIKRKVEPKAATRWLTPLDAVRLIGAAADHLRPLLTFLFCTGARLSEALEIEWKDVDLAGAKVVFWETKGKEGEKKDRAARLPPAAIAALANIPLDASGNREGRVFRRDDGQPYADKERAEGGQIKTALLGAAKRAGFATLVVDDNGVPKRFGKRKVKRWTSDVTAHVCRHSWASWFYAVTRDPILLRDEGGWSELDTVERYAHLVNDPEVVSTVRLVWGDTHPRIGALPTETRAESAHTAHAGAIVA